MTSWHHRPLTLRGAAPVPATRKNDTVVIRPVGWDASNDTPSSWARPGHLYRGMSEAEWHFVQQSGAIRSDERFSVSGEGTNFAEDPGDAESYINFGHSDPRKTGRPNYLVEIENDGSLKRWRDGYWKAREVPVALITRAWIMYPEAGAVVAAPIEVAVARPRMREEPTVWYHGSPQRFERFQSRIRHTFGTSASEVPIFLTRDPEFAALYAGPNGYVYEVRPHVERMFNARAFVLSDRYWPPEREALAPEGQKLYDDLVENRIFPELIRYGTRHEDDDEWATMHDSHGTYSSIMGRDYDVMETTEMKRWLLAHGYDSFLVAGDGPNDNLAVFDPEKIEILGVKARD